jgi:ParB-like chromosome segregation protein Spo0J
MGGPKLQTTKDYDLFDLNEFNRPLHKDRSLENSMKEYGFMPSSPLQVAKNPNGKLKIIKGHHRFSIARKLGLNIWYVVDGSCTDIFYLEGRTITYRA